MALPPEAWDGVLRRLGADAPPFSRDTWLRPLVAKTEGDCLRLLCPSDFHRKRVQAQFLDRIREALRGQYGSGTRVALDVDARICAEHAARVPPEPAAPAAASEEHALTAVPEPAPTRVTPASAGALREELPRQHTFENFVVGDCNALAREAALAVARARHRELRQLYLCADAGLGKTHLARAALVEAQERGCERALYATAEGFTRAYTSAVRAGRMARFNRTFRSGRMLVIEDVQFLEGKLRTQLELFHTVKHVLDVGGRVVLTGQRPPSDMDALDPELRGQIAAGFVASLEAPDAAVRRRILRSKADAGGVRLPDACLDLMVDAVRGSVREIEGALIQLVTTASLMKRSIDLELALEVLAAKGARPGGGPRKLRVDEVLGVVAAFFQTSPAAMSARSRRRDVLLPRQLAMYLCRRYTRASVQEIADAFGRRHPSVRNATLRVEREILERAPLRYKVEALSVRLDELAER